MQDRAVAPTTTSTTAAAQPLNHPDLQRRINALRGTDNVTNCFYLAREYLFLGTVIGSAVAFDLGRSACGLSWLWDVPVAVVAVWFVGVGQHRLVTLGHEASHYLLFRNRLLNELAANFLCFFPVLSIAHNYRLQHLAHHQFPNDPERDPDWIYMQVSGHCFSHPMPGRQFWWRCVVRPLVRVHALLHYILIRAAYAALGGNAGPYRARQRPSRLGTALELLHLAVLVAALTALTWAGNGRGLLFVPAGLALAVLAYTALAPDRLFLQTPVRPPALAQRWWNGLRLLYLTGLFTTLAWLTHRTGAPWAGYYVVFWLVPLGTSFSFLMILREEVQHSNAGRERFRHTRNFEGNPLARWAVFPFGMDYHLPHHLFPMVPHYRLRELHELLSHTDDYRREATVIEGYLLPRGVDDPPGLAVNAHAPSRRLVTPVDGPLTPV